MPTPEQDAFVRGVLGANLPAAGPIETGPRATATPAPVDAVKANGAHHAKPPPKQHHGSTEERLRKAEDDLRGHTKVDIATVGARVLQRQYDDMIAGLQRAQAMRLADIDGWETEDTPVSGKLLLSICKGLHGVAMVAFPEVMFLEIGKQALEFGSIIQDGREANESKDASEKEMKAVKSAARAELQTLISQAQTQASKHEDMFQKLIEDAADKLTPEELDAMQGINEPGKVGDFVRDRLGIKRGETHTPGVVKAMETEIRNQFNAWVKKDFQRRKAGGVSKDVASDAGHSWEALSLRELFRLEQNGDTYGFKITLEALNKDREKVGVPEGWYEEQLEKMRKKLDEKYEKAFEDDKVKDRIE